MKNSNKLWRRALLSITAGLLISQSAITYAARCEYIIQNEWGSGFVAGVRITNDTNTAISGWSVNWSYADGTKKTGGWNANFSGNNPYAASGVGWNDRINPGQTIEFGVQGNKGVANSPAVKPVVSGAVCGSTQSSSSIKSSVLSSSSSSKTSSSAQTTSSSKSSPSSSVTSNSRSSSSSTSSSSSYSTSSFDCRRSSCNDFISSWSSSRSSFSSGSSQIYYPGSSYSSTSSSSSSLYCPQGNTWPDCPFETRRSSSSSSRSSIPNISPVPDLKVNVHGLTVDVDASASTDADGHTLKYTIIFGHVDSYLYPHVWHTFSEAGEYEILLQVSDGITTVTKTEVVNVQEVAGNRAPIARLTKWVEDQSTIASGSASFDFEGTPLTYEWNFGDGPFTGDSLASVADCTKGEFVRSRVITLTVSDGQLKDTIQRSVNDSCGYSGDLMPYASFNYRTYGNEVVFNAGNSYFDLGFSWDFGDGTTGVGLIASHNYTSPGVYPVTLNVQGPRKTDSVTNLVTVGFAGSTSSISSSTFSSGRSLSSTVTSSSSKVSSSSSSSQASSDRNRYTAPRATTAPVIDGVVDSVWDRASWAPINVFWLGTQSNPSAQDYSGRYKALWDENYLYILYDITDDRIYDGVRDPLDRYWEDDTVELFIDENKSGGQHGYNTSAWAYHISTYGDVVDSTTGGAKLLNDHIDSRLVSNGTQHYWELRIRIYGEDYADWKSNTPLTLFAGKLMGFSACYIDNDGSSQRESMMGSVDTQGHKNNQGYLDASVFGSLLLVE